MLRILLPLPAAVAACTSSPQEAGAHTATPVPGADIGQAAQGPMPMAASAAENPLPAASADSPAEAQGRRIFSTAFVRIGPDGHLTVELRDGRVLVLRDVVMRAKDYWGRRVSGAAPGKAYCGSYADVLAVRPGGGPPSEALDPVASNSAAPPSVPAKVSPR